MRCCLAHLLMCGGFLGTTKILARDVGIKEKYYPKHYVVPCGFIRRQFHLTKQKILKFSYFEYFAIDLFSVIFMIEIIAWAIGNSALGIFLFKVKLCFWGLELVAF